MTEKTAPTTAITRAKVVLFIAFSLQRSCRYSYTEAKAHFRQGGANISKASREGLCVGSRCAGVGVGLCANTHRVSGYGALDQAIQNGLQASKSDVQCRISAIRGMSISCKHLSLRPHSSWRERARRCHSAKSCITWLQRDMRRGPMVMTFKLIVLMASSRLRALAAGGHAAAALPSRAMNCLAVPLRYREGAAETPIPARRFKLIFYSAPPELQQTGRRKEMGMPVTVARKPRWDRGASSVFHNDSKGLRSSSGL